ncbi:Abi family protein [Leminorella richardii]|nr:Abi family protein [Leminorella richardii]
MTSIKSTEKTIQAIKRALSPARMSTYESAFKAGADIHAPLDLYMWNAHLSAAFFIPLHFCEVVVRNAIAEALETQYGERWPWSSGFERSLPDPVNGYSQRKDLFSARKNQRMTKKVIPELKFVFWQRLLTRNNDCRLWNKHLNAIFPHIDPSWEINQRRQFIYERLERIRKLRNRIAHHEPIFLRELDTEYQIITQLIHLRSGITAEWMALHQQVQELIQHSPFSTRYFIKQ